MSSGQTGLQRARIDVENVGGIDSTSVSFEPGVTVLSGRNATNRTSLLRALMAALGSDDVSIKGDADEGNVELTIGDETATRRLTRRNGTVSIDGDPYLEDATLADLFAFLLESNEARRAVARGDDLREIIMRPIDTEQIEAEIERLVDRRRQLDEEIQEIRSLEEQLPSLEEQRTQLRTSIEEKREALEEKEAELEAADASIEQSREEESELEKRLAELRGKRSTLEDIRYEIETERETLDQLREERAELESRLDQLPETPMGNANELDERIDRLRSRKQQFESEMNELQSIIRFNEDMLEESDPDILDALDDGRDDTDDTVTDQLVDRTVTCWTCGSDIEADRIEETVDRLRELSRSKLSEINDLESELSELEEQRRELEEQQRERTRTERRLTSIEGEIDDSEAALERLQDRRDELIEEIDDVETEVDQLEDDTYSEVLEIHREANQLEHEIGRLEADLDRVEEEIEDIERRRDELEELEAEREALADELEELRTRIERIEREAIEEFNDHMETVLDLLDYQNLERIWIERIERETRRGRRTVSETEFDLHVIREDSGTTYEDTVDHLSESEREVTGLVFALAGYLAHDVHDEVPFIILDSLEAIDAARIADLVEYLAEFSDYLTVALLPEDTVDLADRAHEVVEF